MRHKENCQIESEATHKTIKTETLWREREGKSEKIESENENEKNRDY